MRDVRKLCLLEAMEKWGAERTFVFAVCICAVTCMLRFFWIFLIYRSINAAACLSALISTCGCVLLGVIVCDLFDKTFSVAIVFCRNRYTASISFFVLTRPRVIDGSRFLRNSAYLGDCSFFRVVGTWKCVSIRMRMERCSISFWKMHGCNLVGDAEDVSPHFFRRGGHNMPCPPLFSL